MAGSEDQDDGRPSEDPFLRAIQARLLPVRAPESLRAQISAMLTIEQALADPRLPQDPPSSGGA